MSVVVILSGGIGNQLFQYSFGKSISRLIDRRLFFYKGLYKTDPLRKIEIHKVVDDVEFTEKFYLKLLLKLYGFFLKTNSISFIENIFKIKLITERANQLESVNISKEKLKNYKIILIWGYFQNKKYFQKTDFNLSERLKKNYNHTYLPTEDTEKLTTVGLHIRRGDYVSNFSNIFNVLSSNYYKEGLIHIKKQIKSDFLIVIFSEKNEKEFIEKIIDEDQKYIVINSNLEDPFNDIILMSKCNHFIAANSSFSWWGAYLNSNKQKIIVCPYNFYVDDLKNRELELYLDDWQKI